MIEKEIRDNYNRKYLYDILKCADVRSSSALYAYANFLNKKGHQFDLIPLYFEILYTNNRYAIDALFKGCVARDFFDFIRVPESFVFVKIFGLFDQFPKNAIYKQTIKACCGYLKHYYRSAKDGFNVYPVSIRDINSIGKYLNEDKDQKFQLNRDILDILLYISELDQHHEMDIEKKKIASHASRIRSDFFDSKRSIVQSISSAILEEPKEISSEISPEGVYLD